jgi:hypothetical protein
MPAIGGSIQSISIRGRLFPVASDADANIQLGGFQNEVSPNGNGTARLLKTRVAWMVDGLQVELDHGRADLEFLQEIADSLEFVDFTIELVDGTVFQGEGQLVDEIQGSTQSATATITVHGQQKLTQQ